MAMPDLILLIPIMFIAIMLSGAVIFSWIERLDHKTKPVGSSTILEIATFIKSHPAIAPTADQMLEKGFFTMDDYNKLKTMKQELSRKEAELVANEALEDALYEAFR